MPYITIKLVEGRSLEVKRKLVAEVTRAVCETLPTTPDNVRIEFQELPKDQFAVAGRLVVDNQ